MTRLVSNESSTFVTRPTLYLMLNVLQPSKIIRNENFLLKEVYEKSISWPHFICALHLFPFTHYEKAFLALCFRNLSPTLLCMPFHLCDLIRNAGYGSNSNFKLCYKKKTFQSWAREKTEQFFLPCFLNCTRTWTCDAKLKTRHSFAYLKI